MRKLLILALLAAFLVTAAPTYDYNNLNTNQVSVGSTATLIAAQRPGRLSVSIVNLSSTDIYIGPSGVTTSSGTLLLGTRGTALTVPSAVAVYGVVATGTASVSYMEVY